MAADDIDFIQFAHNDEQETKYIIVRGPPDKPGLELAKSTKDLKQQVFIREVQDGAVYLKSARDLEFYIGLEFRNKAPRVTLIKGKQCMTALGIDDANGRIYFERTFKDGEFNDVTHKFYIAVNAKKTDTLVWVEKSEDGKKFDIQEADKDSLANPFEDKCNQIIKDFRLVNVGDDRYDDVHDQIQDIVMETEHELMSTVHKIRAKMRARIESTFDEPAKHKTHIQRKVLIFVKDDLNTDDNHIAVMNKEEDLSPLDAIEARLAQMPPGRFMNSPASDMDQKDGDDQKEAGTFSWNGLENNSIWEEFKSICKQAPHGCSEFVALMAKSIVGPTEEMAKEEWENERIESAKAVIQLERQLENMTAEMKELRKKHRGLATRAEKKPVLAEMKKTKENRLGAKADMYDYYRQLFIHLTKPADLMNALSRLADGAEENKKFKSKRQTMVDHCNNDCESIGELRGLIAKWKTRNDNDFQKLTGEYAAKKEYLQNQRGILGALRRRIHQAEGLLQVEERKNETTNAANHQVQDATDQFVINLYQELQEAEIPRAQLQKYHEQGVKLCLLSGDLLKNLHKNSEQLCHQQIKAATAESLKLREPMAESYQETFDETFKQMQTITKGKGGIEQISEEIEFISKGIEQQMLHENFDEVERLEDEKEGIQKRLEIKNKSLEKHEATMLSLKNDWDGKHQINMQTIYHQLAAKGNEEAEACEDPEKKKGIKERCARWKITAEEAARDKLEGILRRINEKGAPTIGYG